VHEKIAEQECCRILAPRGSLVRGSLVRDPAQPLLLAASFWLLSAGSTEMHDPDSRFKDSAIQGFSDSGISDSGIRDSGIRD
jgi:hypothetical protein